MNILVSGASGLVGTALVPWLQRAGHEVIPLTRRPASCSGVLASWNPSDGRVDLARAGRVDAVIHLAGETIAQRWTPAAKARIRQSRVHGTRLLAGALAELSAPPSVLISASAVGYYGDRQAEPLDEDSPAGHGFLAEVAQEWEASTAVAHNRGLRVVQLRLGIVLTPRGGALSKLLPLFRLGLGGAVGGGEQFWSWVHLKDLLRVILYCLTHQGVRGPVNAVAPEPVTNREFTRALACVLRRPARIPVPGLAVRCVLGEMGKETLLASTRVLPVRLKQSGFEFQFPRLEPALRDLVAEGGLPAP